MTLSAVPAAQGHSLNTTTSCQLNTWFLLVRRTSGQLGRDQQEQAGCFYRLLSGKRPHFAPAPCGACPSLTSPSRVSSRQTSFQQLPPGWDCPRLPLAPSLSRCVSGVSGTLVYPCRCAGRKGGRRCSGRRAACPQPALGCSRGRLLLIQQLSTLLSVTENRFLADGQNSSLDPSART